MNTYLYCGYQPIYKDVDAYEFSLDYGMSMGHVRSKRGRGTTQLFSDGQPYMPHLAAMRAGNSPLTQKLLAVMREGILDEINIY